MIMTTLDNAKSGSTRTHLVRAHDTTPLVTGLRAIQPGPWNALAVASHRNPASNVPWAEAQGLFSYKH